MKKHCLIFLSIISTSLVGCEKKPLVIPTVDVENIKINLPSKPTYNTGSPKNDNGYDYLDFYEISDFHGACEYTANSTIGITRLGDYFSKKRSLNPGGTILLSGGDMFQGSAESNLTRGYLVNYSMNYMGFDSMTLGNHEFDWTDEWIIKNSNLKYNDYSIPYLAANLIDTNTNERPTFVKPSISVTRGNHKIGIIGTVGQDLENSILKTCIDHYEFVDEIECVNKEAKALHDDGCDVVVWSTHNGLYSLFDMSLNSLTGVDAIFGGHIHSNLTSEIYTQDGAIPFASTANYGKGVAHIQLKINQNKKVTASICEVDENPLNLPSLKEDKNVSNIVDQFMPKINKIKKIKLGRAKDDFVVEKELKNLCVKSMSESALDFASKNDIPTDKIIAAYHNVTGGIRCDINKGKVTFGDVYKPFPFDNEIVLYKVSGANYKRSFNTFSNLGCWHTFGSLSDLNSEEEYYIVLTDYIALTYLGYQDSDLIRTGAYARDCVANHIYNKNVIKLEDYSSSLKEFKSIKMY